MTTRIVFNGQEYASLDAMPPDVRQAYDRVIQQLGDADHDGIPDILQAGAGVPMNVKHTSTTISINSRKYSSPDEMPPDVRALYEKAMAAGAAEPPRVTRVETRFVTGPRDRAGTPRGTGRQLANWVLLLLLALALALVYASFRHR